MDLIEAITTLNQIADNMLSAEPADTRDAVASLARILADHFHDLETAEQAENDRASWGY